MLTPSEAKHALDLIKIAHALAKEVLANNIAHSSDVHDAKITTLAKQFMELEYNKANPPLPTAITSDAEDLTVRLKARVSAHRHNLKARLSATMEAKHKLQMMGLSGLQIYQKLSQTHGKHASTAYTKGAIDALDNVALWLTSVSPDT